MDTRTALSNFRPTAAPLAPIASQAEDPRENAGQSLLSVCWRRRWTVVAVAVLVVAAGCVYLNFAPKMYTSRARLIVGMDGPRLLAANTNTDDAQVDAYINRQCAVLQAEPILTKALDATHADQLHTFDGQPNRLVAIQNALNVSIGKKDDIITIEFDSKYSEEAPVVVNGIIAAYQDYAASQTQSSAAGVLKVLQHEKDNQEQALDDKQKEMVAFKKAHGEMFFTNEHGTNILTQNLATIGDQLTRARLAATSAYATYSQANSRSASYRVWQEAETQAQEYEKLYESEKAKALEINGAQAEFQKLQQEADRSSKVCDALDSRIKEVNVTENTGAMNIQVLETAKVEERPTKPNKKVILLAAAAAGLALGCGAGLLHDAMDQRVRAPDESGRLLGLPVLGAIPAVRHAVAAARPQFGRAVQFAPNTDVAEAYRTLRAAVHFGWPDRSAKSLLVTSPDRGDGKSTTASNLAISMAQAGVKTLLIDADLRAAVQHKIFDVPNGAGLTDLITRGLRPDQAVRGTGVDGLSLLTSGTPSANPGEITNGQSFGRLLEQLEEQYDLIVIDSPPLLPVADARILGAQAGLTLLTVRAEKTTRQDVKQACQQLLSVGSSILGVVLNGVTVRRRAYDYGYGANDVRGTRAAKLVDSTLLPGRALPTGQEPNGHALTY